ncbi:Thiol-disulfide isomerase or thioredoxin [Chitinophaga eiseniae]|uniref:Thiol-disulfide isomerase or thioredoxin n=1 Tax=Chitinophaga eiseniae TaxID=634771 RepID=A0A1T4U490_9BACT|nr:TlpA disulfide reductase family protein [Chitinophaga eiseniae]SKA47351.1 Thiol-disulfide isomerase or thioredoxin [Chitinophaga eiseniae]
MKKIITTLSGACLALGSLAQSGQQITLQGNISGDLKGHHKMYIYTRTYKDSTVMENGHYSFKIPFSGPVFMMLLPEYIQAERQMYVPYGVLMDKPTTYTVTSDITKGMNASTVKGSEAPELYQAYGKEKAAAWKTISATLKKEFGKPWVQENDPQYEAFQKRQEELQKQYLLPLLEKLVKQHPNSYATVFSLNDARQIATVDQQARLYAMLSIEMQASAPAKEFHQFTDGIRNSAIGKQVRDFSLPDPQGKLIPFSSLKGKYVLIDFWASWCAPCRKSFPHMREVYQQYKDQNFVIYSISIDKSKTDWLKAVGEENNPWLQSLDNINVAGSGFAITGVPTTYLIAPDGKIMMKEIGFDETGNGNIEKKLASLFGGAVKKAEEKPKTEGKVIKAMPMTPMQ